MTVFQIFYVTSPLKAETRKYENTQNDIAAEIAYCAVTLLVCFLMIVGVYKVIMHFTTKIHLKHYLYICFQNNKRLILPWLVLKCMECIAWSIITFIVFVLFFFVEAKLVMILLFFYTVFFTSKCKNRLIILSIKQKTLRIIFRDKSTIAVTKMDIQFQIRIYLLSNGMLNPNYMTKYNWISIFIILEKKKTCIKL